MPRIYEIADAETAETLGFATTKRDASQDARFWRDRGTYVTVNPIDYASTKEGVVDLLRRFGRSSG